jgi:hypothetical protein
MIRLLTMVVLLSLSTFGWASAYEGVPNTFKDGDTIKAVDFNTNNRALLVSSRYVSGIYIN